MSLNQQSIAQITFTKANIDSTHTADFIKQNDSWNWRFKFLSFENFGDNFSWDINESIYSNLITPKNSPSRWKDEYKSQRLFFFTFDENKIGLYTNSWILIDKQNNSEKEYSTNTAGAFVKYKPEQSISITPYLGYQRANNISNSDWGWDTGIEGKISNYKSGNYKSTLAASIDYDKFENRENYINKFSGSILTDFTRFSRDSIKLEYEESSKEFYTPTDTGGTKLLKVDYFSRVIQNLLFYDISSNKFLKFQTDIESKNIRYLTTRKIFTIGSELSFLHIGNDYNYKLNFKTSDETNDNEKLRTDSRSRQSSLGIRSSYYFNSLNNLNLDVSYSKLQYDTPDDSVNHDDRDEQRVVVDFEYWHQFSPVLFLTINANGFLFHQIYLSGEQSHNNNWNRIIELSPEVSYKKAGLSNKLSTTVSANYTQYDFDHLFLEKRSFLSRKYSLTDSLMFPVLSLLKIGFLGKIEREEKGSFFAKKFSQNIIQSFSSLRMNTFVTKSLFQKLTFKLGYSYFERKEFQHMPKKEKVRTIVHTGPFINFGYLVKKKVDISGYMSLNQYQDSSLRNSSFINSYLKLIYYL